MFQHHKEIRRFLFIALLLVSVPIALHAQGNRPQPKWWFGGAAAANFNFYNGTAQIINACLTTPTPFHRGSGVGLYAALGIEWRPNPVWGGMLYAGYDNRSGKWKDVVTPCGQPASLSTTLSYLSIEPSLRIAPFSSSFYIFLGPRLGINKAKNIDMANRFTYKEAGKPDAKDDWCHTNKTVVSAQVGAGYDIPLSSAHDPTQVDLSPFVSFHPYFGQNPRSLENWAVTTLRAGVILKIGHAAVAEVARAPEEPPPPPPEVEKPVTPVVTPPPPDTTGQAARERQARMDADMARIQTAYFDYNASVIPANQRDKIKTNAEIFRTWPEWQITVEGYCDERGSDEYNLALGERRATAAKQALVAEGIATTRITTISYGKERPVDPGHDESAWSHNRRTEFKVK